MSRREAEREAQADNLVATLDDEAIEAGLEEIGREREEKNKVREIVLNITQYRLQKNNDTKQNLLGLLKKQLEGNKKLITLCNNRGRSPLSTAAVRGNVEALKLMLIELGDEKIKAINAANNNGDTPLTLALKESLNPPCFQGQTLPLKETIELLCKRRINPILS